MTTQHDAKNVQAPEKNGFFARILRSLSLAGAWMEGGSSLMAGYSVIAGPMGEPFFVPVAVEPAAEARQSC